MLKARTQMLKALTQMLRALIQMLRALTQMLRAWTQMLEGKQSVAPYCPHKIISVPLHRISYYRI